MQAFLREAQDLEALVGAFHIVRAIASTAPFADYIASWTYGDLEHADDEELRHRLQQLVLPSWHYACTARMGPEGCPRSVCDPTLRVRGVRSLRVADTSVMPSVTAANTNATAMMIGRKAAQLILTDYLPKRGSAKDPDGSCA